MRPISISSITINTFYMILKGRVAVLLRPKSTSSIIITAITSLIFMKTFMNTKRSNRCTKKCTIVAWVMGGRVSGLGPISTSPTTISSFSNISRGRVSGILRRISKSTIINTYITPLVTITTTYISPLITIINTHRTSITAITTILYSIIFMEICVNRMRRN